MVKLMVIGVSAFCRMPRALYLLLKVKTSYFFCGSVEAKLMVIEVSAFCRSAEGTVFTFEG